MIASARLTILAMDENIRAGQEPMAQLAHAERLPWGERLMTYNSGLAQELGIWAHEHGRRDVCSRGRRPLRDPPATRSRRRSHASGGDPLSLLGKLFGIGETNAPPTPSNETPTNSVVEIIDAIDHLPVETARYVASFAYVLGRVAHADQHVSEAESNKMLQIVQRLGHLPDDQATLVVDIAQNQTRLFGSTQDFLVTREFAKISDNNQRVELLDCLFAVSAADDSISSVEEAAIRQIAGELGFDDRDYLAARSAWNHKRDVLKDLPGT